MNRRVWKGLALLLIAAAPPALAAPPRQRPKTPPARPEPPPLPEVPPADLARLTPQDFSDEDLDLPYYLEHLHTVANAVDSSGPTRGFIRYGLRYEEDDTDNARVMETVLSLAWFYTASRSWNPYRGHPALRARLEAALDFWSKSERERGPFTKRERGRWSLAETAFATKFFGETLILLSSGRPKISAKVYARALESDRRAVEATLTLRGLYAHGMSYTNQYTNVWGGGLALLSLGKDAELERLWKARFTDSHADFQSPAGYYYEKDGPDFGYTIGTHRSNVRQAWAWLRGTPLGDELLARERKWFDWLAMNALPEPNGGGFILNGAIGTRQRDKAFHDYTNPLGEYTPLVRAFAESREERALRYATERAALVAAWPKVPAIRAGRRVFSAYAFLFRRFDEWLPSSAEKKAARRLLPTLARQRFTQQRRDSRKKVTYSFVQRPRYYAAFTTGEKLSSQQRYGLGLLWNARLGSVLQSQVDSDDAAWGTRAAGAPRVYEGESFTTNFALARAPLPTIPPGVTDLAKGDLEARYPLGKAGEKVLRFLDWKINVSVRHTGNFTETLPLLSEADGQLLLEPGKATLKGSRGSLIIRFDRSAKASMAESDTRVHSKRLVVLTLRAKNELDYSLECSPR